MKNMKKWASSLAVLFVVLTGVFPACGGEVTAAASFDLPASGLPITGLPASGDYGGSALDDLMKSLTMMKEFDAKRYGLEGSYEVVGETVGKLEEEGGACRIRLAALRREDGVYNRGYFLEIISPAPDEDSFVIPVPGDVRGFEQSISLKNFMSREKSEILLTVGGGNAGDRFLVIAVAGKEGEVILDTHAANIPAVAGRFFNDYRAEVVVPETGERALIDLSPRKAEYNKNMVYNESGTLRRRRGVTVWVDKLSLFEPVDADGDGIMEIREVMDLDGIGRAGRVAYVEASLKYAGGAWSVIDSWIAPAEDLSKLPVPIRIR